MASAVGRALPSLKDLSYESGINTERMAVIECAPQGRFIFGVAPQVVAGQHDAWTKVALEMLGIAFYFLRRMHCIDKDKFEGVIFDGRKVSFAYAHEVF